MDCGMVGDVHPKEMIIDNISSQQCNEAYTVINCLQVPAVKETTSVHVKIDTRSGGNIILLFLFQQLHPKQTSPDGLPIGLDPIWTKLTTYNGSPIPLYGILCSPILWQPNTPGAPTTHDSLILVHCRHTWSCSLGSPSMWEVSCGPKWTVLSRPLNPIEVWQAQHPLWQQEQQNHPQQEHWSPSASNPLMTWQGNSLIDSLELANSQVNIRYNYI